MSAPTCPRVFGESGKDFNHSEISSALIFPIAERVNEFETGGARV